MLANHTSISSLFQGALRDYDMLRKREATALNKRLKDIMDKQKANSKFGKGAGASNTG